MKKSNRKMAPINLITFSAATLLACLFSASNALADDRFVHSETLTYADLNLDTPAGIQTLYDRIHSVARRVCFNSSKHLEVQVIVDECAREAEVHAIEELKIPALTAYYERKTGNSTKTIVAGK
jgi:UrcA family protein